MKKGFGMITVFFVLSIMILNGGQTVSNAAESSVIYTQDVTASSYSHYVSSTAGGNANQVSDNNLTAGTSGWWHSGAGETQWVAIDYSLGNEKKIGKLNLLSGATGYGGCPKDFKVKASNDSTNGIDGTWVDVYSVVDNPKSINTWQSHEFTPPELGYRWYKVETSALWDYSYFIVTEWEMMEVNEYSEDLIPVMTSNTNPEGQVIYSNDPGGPVNGAFTCFDNKVAGSGWCATLPAYIGYEFASNKIISQYTITSYPAQNPIAWTFEAWDGENWIILDTQSNIESWQNYEKKTFNFNNANSYKKYKINFTNGNVTYNNKIYIYEAEMMEKINNAPETPTNLSITYSNNQVSLGWDLVADATSYNVKRATTAGGPYTTIAESVTETTYTDTTVVNGTEYYYVVSAVNIDGESGNSQEISAMVDYIVVSNIINYSTNMNYLMLENEWTGLEGLFTNNDNNLGLYALNWNSEKVYIQFECDSIVGMRLRARGNAVATTGYEAVKLFTLVGSNDDFQSEDIIYYNSYSSFTEYQEYIFEEKVTYKAYRLYVDEWWHGNQLDGQNIEKFLLLTDSDPIDLVAPSNLVATSNNETINLSWNEVFGANRYKVKRATTTGGPYTTIAESVTESTYTDTTVVNGITYYYVVSAVNAVGEGEISEEVSATPQLAGPTNVKAQAGDGQVTITWDAVANATGYNVKYSTKSSGPYAMLVNNITDTTIIDYDALNNVTYYYVVSAILPEGESANSHEVDATPIHVGSARAIIAFTMTNGMHKEYDMTLDEVAQFLEWYNNAASGTGSMYYIIPKTDIGPYLKKNDYIIYSKILYFEINEYYR